MQFKNILNNRFYINTTNETFLEESPLDLIQNIFKDAKLNIPTEEQISLIDSNYEYDSYKIETLNQFYCVKVSYDENNNSLKREFDLLKSIDCLFFPKIINYNLFNYGLKIHYLITSYEEGESINKFQESLIIENYNLFFKALSSLNSVKPPKDKINWMVDKLFKYTNFDNAIPQHTIESIKLKYNIDDLKKFILNIKSEIKSLYKNVLLDKNVFCHGNLKPSNILYSGDGLKFINLENNFSGNVYFDLASLSINFKLNQDLDREFFKKYLLYNNIVFTPKEWESYKICYSIMIRKILLELIIEYFFENFVLNQVRRLKIYNIICLYTYNCENFYKIPSFISNFDLISDIFSEAIIGNENE